MTRTAYYDELKRLARALRAEYAFQTPRVQISDLRRIYRAEGIRIELWPPAGRSSPSARLRHLRGAYLDEPPLPPWVMVARSLPAEQRIYTLAHELKHHFRDRSTGLVHCLRELDRDPREIGAEIFAVELIFPDEDFVRSIAEMRTEQGECSAETIVRLKASTRTTLSYTSLAKRTEFMGFAPPGSFKRVRWKILAEHVLGEPVYKRVLRARTRRAGLGTHGAACLNP